MASYYTYGAIPDVEETVFGALPQAFAEGGEVDEEEPVAPPVPEGGGIDYDAMSRLFGMLGSTKSLEPLGGFGVYGPLSGVKEAKPTQTTLADYGLTEEEANEIAAQYKGDQAAAAPLAGLSMAEIAEQAGVSEKDLLASQEQIGGVFGARQNALEQISGLLQSNDFKGAFDAALKAEQELGSDFVGNILDPNKMRMLRGPMDADEITKFYNEMPEDVFKERYVGAGNEYKKEQAIERNIAALEGGSGYADPTLGVKKEETLVGKLPIKEIAGLAAAAMLGTAVPGLFGAAGKGAAGAGAGAAGGAGAGAAGAGAAGAAGLTGVVPSGLLAGTTAANLALPVFTVTAGGGLTAAQLAALAAAGGAGAVAGGSGASAGSTASTPTTPEAPLEEVVVTGSKPPVVPPEVVAPVVGGLPEAFPEVPDVEPPLEEVTVEAKRPVEPEVSVPPIIEPPIVEPPFPEGPLEEVTVEAKRPVEPEVIVTPVVTPPTPPVEPPFPEGPLEEVTVEAKRPVEPEIVVPPVVTPPTSPVDTAFPEGPIEEVVVETERPVETDVVVPPVVVPPSPPVEPPFPEGPIEEVVVETERPPVDDELIIPPVVVPPTTPVDGITEPEINKPDPLKDLKDKYLDLEKLIKLIGAIGSARSKPPAPPTTPGTGTGGMGGALPKYTYNRRQLSPDIDYFTYGTRPEAKFFEDSMQLEKPVQPGLPEPELPPASPPGDADDMIFGAQVIIPATVNGVEGYYTDSTKRTFVPYPKNTTGPYVGPAPLSTEPQFAEEDPDFYRRAAMDAADTDMTERNRELARLLAAQQQPETGMATGGLTGYAKGGSNESRYVAGPGSGREDKIPALLSDGEYVIDAETLALLGDGSTKEGARRMDKFRANIRQHKGRALSRGRISPNAKSPDKYMGGGLT